MAGIVISFLVSNRQTPKPEAQIFKPKLEMLDISSSFEPKPYAHRFPFKCTVTLRNESPETIDVRAIRYEQELIGLKDFSSQALKIKFDSTWCPSEESVTRLAVLPSQEFRVWVGLDERLDENYIRERHGRMGKLILSVNNTEFPIQI